MTVIDAVIKTAASTTDVTIAIVVASALCVLVLLNVLLYLILHGKIGKCVARIKKVWPRRSRKKTPRVKIMKVKPAHSRRYKGLDKSMLKSYLDLSESHPGARNKFWDSEGDRKFERGSFLTSSLPTYLDVDALPATYHKRRSSLRYPTSEKVHFNFNNSSAQFQNINEADDGLFDDSLSGSYYIYDEASTGASDVVNNDVIDRETDDIDGQGVRRDLQVSEDGR